MGCVNSTSSKKTSKGARDARKTKSLRSLLRSVLFADKSKSSGTIASETPPSSSAVDPPSASNNARQSNESLNNAFCGNASASCNGKNSVTASVESACDPGVTQTSDVDVAKVVLEDIGGKTEKVKGESEKKESGDLEVSNDQESRDRDSLAANEEGEIEEAKTKSKKKKSGELEVGNDQESSDREELTANEEDEVKHVKRDSAKAESGSLEEREDHESNKELTDNEEHEEDETDKVKKMSATENENGNLKAKDDQKSSKELTVNEKEEKDEVQEKSAKDKNGDLKDIDDQESIKEPTVNKDALSALSQLTVKKLDVASCEDDEVVIEKTMNKIEKVEHKSAVGESGNLKESDKQGSSNELDVKLCVNIASRSAPSQLTMKKLDVHDGASYIYEDDEVVKEKPMTSRSVPSQLTVKKLDVYDGASYEDDEVVKEKPMTSRSAQSQLTMKKFNVYDGASCEDVEVVKEKPMTSRSALSHLTIKKLDVYDGASCEDDKFVRKPMTSRSALSQLTMKKLDVYDGASCEDDKVVRKPMSARRTMSVDINDLVFAVQKLSETPRYTKAKKKPALYTRSKSKLVRSKVLGKKRQCYKKRILYYWLERCRLIDDITSIKECLEEQEKDIEMYTALNTLQNPRLNRRAIKLRQSIKRLQRNYCQNENSLYDLKRELVVTEAKLDQYLTKFSQELRYADIYYSTRKSIYLTPIPEESERDLEEYKQDMFPSARNYSHAARAVRHGQQFQDTATSTDF